MKYSVSIDSFDRKEYRRPISEITKTRDTRRKEKYFKKIASRLLERHRFQEIADGQEVSKRQGVPFDFLALRNKALSLIELKGSRDTFNYSKDVQFARLHHVVNELKKRKIKTSIFLLQINLKYGLYQILDSKFYSEVFGKIDTKSTGRDKPIIPIVDDIISWMRRMGVNV